MVRLCRPAAVRDADHRAVLVLGRLPSRRLGYRRRRPQRRYARPARSRPLLTRAMDQRAHAHAGPKYVLGKLCPRRHEYHNTILMLASVLDLTSVVDLTVTSMVKPALTLVCSFMSRPPYGVGTFLGLITGLWPLESRIDIGVVL
jgi:hypothetical protein